MVKETDRSEPNRRGRILDAARQLMLRNGLRGTTMEAIAREAGIAKPTLYGYFPDKGAIYEALVGQLFEQVDVVFANELGREGPVASRVAAALAAKHRTTAKVLAGSPHADELYGEHERMPGERLRSQEQRIEVALTVALDEAGVEKARPLVLLMMAAAYGIARKARDPAEIGPAIRLMVERVLAPELPQDEREAK